ncbi:hypothetical protein AAHE18_11G102200 [Arachis hypogaea]
MSIKFCFSLLQLWYLVGRQHVSSINPIDVLLLRS